MQIDSIHTSAAPPAFVLAPLPSQHSEAVAPERNLGPPLPSNQAKLQKAYGRKNMTAPAPAVKSATLATTPGPGRATPSRPQKHIPKSTPEGLEWLAHHNYPVAKKHRSLSAADHCALVKKRAQAFVSALHRERNANTEVRALRTRLDNRGGLMMLAALPHGLVATPWGFGLYSALSYNHFLPLSVDYYSRREILLPKDAINNVRMGVHELLTGLKPRSFAELYGCERVSFWELKAKRQSREAAKRYKAVRGSKPPRPSICVVTPAKIKPLQRSEEPDQPNALEGLSFDDFRALMQDVPAPINPHPWRTPPGATST